MGPDATAERLEDLQVTLNEGACMETAATGRPVFMPDLHDGTDAARWPTFAVAVVEQTLIGGAVRVAAAVGCGQSRGVRPCTGPPRAGGTCSGAMRRPRPTPRH